MKDSGTPLYESMNLTQARTALIWLGRSLVALNEPETAGLAHVFWLGPWSAAGPRVQYTKSHWIAYRSVAGTLFVYDVNAGDEDTDGGWLPLSRWETEVMPRLLPKKGTSYRINRWLELDL